MVSPEFFIDIIQLHYGCGVDLACNNNEYQECFLGGKGSQCIGLTTLPPSCLEIWEPQPPGTLRAINRLELGFISFTNFNAQFLYSITICRLLYNPQHVSSIYMPIFRRTNCIITASGIVALCKRLHSRLDEIWHTVQPLQRVTIPDAVIIQFVLLKMGM